jgi:hypothetical protein
MSGVLESAIIGREPELRAVERFLDRAAKDAAALLIEGPRSIRQVDERLDPASASRAAATSPAGSSRPGSGCLPH